MNNDTKNSIERESRKWWYSEDGCARDVVGYSCAPSSPESWWCPEVGYTLNERHHLFVTRPEAVKAAIRKTTLEIDALQGRLRKLEAMR
jgi:hypothetical protein